MASPNSTAREVLTAFLDTVAGNDADAIAAFFAEDAVYTNVQAPVIKP